MVERCGNLDQPLQKSLLRRFCVQPDFFPGFVGFEKFSSVEERNAVIEDGLLLGAIIFYAPSLGAQGMSAFRLCTSGGFGFRAQVPA
jgi:hypothetical protein